MNVGFVVFLSFVFRGNCDESILLSPVERIAPNDLGWAEKSIVALLVDVGVVVVVGFHITIALFQEKEP